jgi:hypothetical protein
LYLLVEETANERCFELGRRLWGLAHDRARDRQPGCDLERNAQIRADRCTYRVRWSEEGGVFVASCEEFPCLCWRDVDRVQALAGVVRLVRERDVGR